jgi:hypothetical protein
LEVVSMAHIGSDFIRKIYNRMIRCSECGLRIPAGEMVLVSMKKGKVKKIVCGEDCRQEFDARFWSEAAANGRRKRQSLRGTA